ncbi:MAG: 2-C-methyl-D-erythritol 4-phosphate cytidylyltransferase [Verrucomicrobia bacterium]|nr:2-C-methyl-D-erythritol 4-phosphate cytidylyltransferase [Verrucomicrobiota bacterium]
MTSAIIVAAGKGTRMGPSVDKIFLEVAGQPLVVHTWRRFDSSRWIDEIILVVRDGLQSSFQDLASTSRFTKPFQLVAGGPERQDSVWNGLLAVSPQSEIVVIQDAARPCTTDRLIGATVEAARETGAAVAAQRVTDTIKESSDGTVIRQTLDRTRLWAVQTPQTFRVALIRRALAAAREKGLSLTDDTAACEFIGAPVRLVQSQTPNPKATSPADLPYLDLLLRSDPCNSIVGPPA